MGRKQLWDRADVLSSAMRLFRHRGYQGASLRDIEAATGLHPGSLYRTFESKDGLFRAALDAYNDQVVQGRVARASARAGGPSPGIRSFFTSAFDTGLDPDPGCLLTNTAVESFTVPQAADGVRRGLATIEAGFADALTRARTLGLVRPDLDVDLSAVRLLALYQGLLVLVRAGTPLTKLHTITDGAIASIETEKRNSDE